MGNYNFLKMVNVKTKKKHKWKNKKIMKYKIKKNKKKDTYSQHCNKYKEFKFLYFSYPNKW